MNQLESNASNLSEITAIINSKQDSALEMMQRALKVCHIKCECQKKKKKKMG